MKIQRIETYTSGAIGVVKVVAEDGSEGFGQMAPFNADISALVLHRHVAPVALGADAFGIDALAAQVMEANYKFPGSYVRRSFSGLDTALWDLRGKLEGRPVCELLGGTPGPVPVYGSSMSRSISPEHEAARMARLRDDQGFRAFKLRIGKVNGHNQDEWPGRTEALVPTVRKAVGDHVALLVDANGCYTAQRAIEVGYMLEANGVVHFEEPCPYWEYEWTAQVAESLQVPVAGGEQDCFLHQWRRMIAMRAVDIAQPDVCYVGGVARLMQVARMAADAGLLCVPHAANRSMLQVFTMHILRAIPNAGPFMEYSIESQESMTGIYDPMPRAYGGEAEFPEGPGWGITVRPEWLEAADRQVSEV